MERVAVNESGGRNVFRFVGQTRIKLKSQASREKARKRGQGTAARASRPEFNAQLATTQNGLELKRSSYIQESRPVGDPFDESDTIAYTEA